MPFIMNCLDTPINTQAHGKWFQWKPKQIKEIQNQELAMFFMQHRGEEGLVGIPDYVMELDHNSKEFSDYVEDKRKEGVNSRIRKLTFIISNLEQSLRYDLETKNIKADPLAFASKGELAAYKELATLKEYERQQHLNLADEIKKIKEVINGNVSVPEPRKADTGRPDFTKSAKS